MHNAKTHSYFKTQAQACYYHIVIVVVSSSSSLSISLNYKFFNLI